MRGEMEGEMRCEEKERNYSVEEVSSFESTYNQ
jgi:hypothetical protein